MRAIGLQTSWPLRAELHNPPLHLTAARDRVRPQVNGMPLCRQASIRMNDSGDQKKIPDRIHTCLGSGLVGRCARLDRPTMGCTIAKRSCS